MSTASVSIEKKLNRGVSLLLRKPTSKNVKYPKVNNFTYEEFLSDKMLIIEAIRNGIPYRLFELMLDNTLFSMNELANFLDISLKSLQRYKKTSKNFKSLQSEKIIELAEVTKVGLDVFGELDKLKLWLNTPNYSLGNFKPIELLKYSYGKELVIGELTRINYGIFV